MKRLEQIEAFVFDMDGTLYTGDTPIPGGRELIARLKERGKRVRYFTNNSSRCGDDYLARLRELGFPVSQGEVLTSGDAALAFVKRTHAGKRAYVFGTRALQACFGSELFIDKQNPELIIMGFHTEMKYSDLVTLCGFLRRGLPFIATHPDKTCPAEPFPVPDVGSFLKLLECATGRTPDAICGKPSTHAGELLRANLNLPAERIAFVGDRDSTDMQFARNNGFLSVRVLSGAHEEGEGPVDVCLDSVADLLQII